ncbi:MAG: UPF0104 family protein [Ramlibacter sp.]|nr:UPF0104 family protein [Ramlibacter sp.]MBX3659813.1 UPF0104 family protein [Ramlibacter sp.]
MSPSQPAAALAAPGTGAGLARGLTRQTWWPWARRGITLVFFGLITWLLVNHARTVDWPAVGAALMRKPPAVLVAALALAAASHALYSCFDLLGRHTTGHALSTRTVMGITFASYAFNLNLGSLIGGVGFRFRLYSRFGLSGGTIARVLSVSLLTNWLGYVLLAGVVFLAFPPTLPAAWPVPDAALRALGAVLVALAGAYLGLAGLSPRRSWTLRGQTLRLPGARLATLQLAMSCANWLLVAALIWVLLEGRVAFTVVLGVYLLAAIAGVVTYVPAGLGVLEAVFIALLGSQVGETRLLAALLAYRTLYYLVPLALAAVLYPWLEARSRRRR